jgi:hypothetical protein
MLGRSFPDPSAVANAGVELFEIVDHLARLRQRLSVLSPVTACSIVGI